MKKLLYILLLILTASCGISEDCFKGNGNQVTQTYPVADFTKIKVYSGVGLVIKEGENYEVKVVTSDNIQDEIEVSLDGDMLIVKDNSSCNLARDYGVTTVYVTAPNIEEIYSKTDKDIKSDGVLSYPSLRLYSIEDNDGAGTGDFYLEVNIMDMQVVTNSMTNFNLIGRVHNIHLSFDWGDGRFLGKDLRVTNHLSFFHRGSNDLIVFPTYTFEGNIYGTGDVIMKNEPEFTPVVFEHFTGKLIRDY